MPKEITKEQLIRYYCLRCIENLAIPTYQVCRLLGKKTIKLSYPKIFLLPTLVLGFNCTIAQHSIPKFHTVLQILYLC